MSAEELKAIARRHYEEANRLEAAFEFIAPDVVFHGLAPMRPTYREWKLDHKKFIAAFPDLELTIEDQLVEGNTVVTRWTMRGTHRRKYMDVLPNDQLVTVSGISIDRIAGGKVVEHWQHDDILSMMLQRSTPERLAYWYFRLNGFMTIENFLVHPETGYGARTDVDILATRFAQRLENFESPMKDDERIAKCETFTNIIIAEIKKGPCRLNGPWTDRGDENMERVLSAIGCCATEDEVTCAANSLYDNGIWSNDIVTVRLFAIGESMGDIPTIAPEQQIVWEEIIEFCADRFKKYKRQKKANTQWSLEGKVFRKLSLRDDRRAIRRYFGLNSQETSV